jgi:predicted dehydrogenase
MILSLRKPKMQHIEIQAVKCCPGTADAVVVTTPHSVHAEVCLAAFERGIHVLNEKPMATSWEACQALVQMAEAREVIFMALPYTMDNPILTAQSLLTEENLGKITGAEACLNIPGPVRANWYYKKAVAQGGAMLDCMIYPVSRLIHILGGARYVTGFVNTLIPRRIVSGSQRVQSDVDDNVTLLIQFESGQVAVVRTLWGTAFEEDSTTIYGRKGTIILPGDGRVILQRRSSKWPQIRPTVWRGWKGCEEMPSVTATENIMEHFVRCLREGREPSCSGRRQLHIHEILFKGYEAAREGRTCALKTSFTPWHNLDPSLFDTSSSYV